MKQRAGILAGLVMTAAAAVGGSGFAGTWEGKQNGRLAPKLQGRVLTFETIHGKKHILKDKKPDDGPGHTLLRRE